jgi:hypothetical protein
MRSSVTLPTRRLVTLATTRSVSVDRARLVSLPSMQYTLTCWSTTSVPAHCRAYSTDGRKVVQFNLADVGEGIAECEVLKWFVDEGQPIEAFQKLCEVQSDKATVEITSRFDGIVKRLHYRVGDMARVGSPLADIAVEDDGTGGSDAAVTDDGERGRDSVSASVATDDSPTLTRPNAAVGGFQPGKVCESMCCPNAPLVLVVWIRANIIPIMPHL